MLQSHGYTGFPQRSKLQKGDLMSLNTITEKDAPPKNKKWGNLPSNSLTTQDIDGARPALKGYGFINKQEFNNSVDGIERAKPSALHQQLNRKEYNLSSKDIEGAYPKKTEFTSTRVGTNPLNPIYKLPYYETRPITPPRFIRDSYNIQDIEGTKPVVYCKWQMRNNMSTHDIEGARPKPETTWKKPNFTNPQDINSDGLFKTNRCSNPLNPSYQHRNQDEQVLYSQITEIGDVQGSRPKVFVNLDKSTHNRHLSTQDIEGARTGTVGVGPLGSYQRNQIRHPCESQDIMGAQSGSLKKGITTMRESNPLDPKYQDLGRSEEIVQNSVNAPKTFTSNPQFDKDHAKFWGTTPPQSVGRASSVQTKTTNRRNPEIIRNAARFFQGKPSSNPDDDQINFQQNANLFYNSPGNFGHPKFQNIYNSASIHRKKPYIPQADSQDFELQQRKFYGVPSSAGSVAKSEVRSMSTDMHIAAKKFYGDTASQASSSQKHFQQNTAKFYDSAKPIEPYNFKLNRQTIGRPGKQPINPLQKDFSTNNYKFFGASPPPSSGQNSYLVAAERFYGN